MSKFAADFKEIITKIAADKDRFYGKKYGKFLTPEIIESPDDRHILNLEPMSFEDLFQIPFRERTYPRGFVLNRIVTREGKSFIMSRSRDEIERTNIKYSSRPLVAFENVYDAIEYSLYCYSKRVLPLIGEAWNDEIIYSTARKYGIDGFICDRNHFLSLTSRLTRENNNLRDLVIIDSSFEEKDFLMLPEIRKDFILSVPEAGRIAYLCDASREKGAFIFHPFEDVLIEPGFAKVTSSRLKTTPLIRYQTNIFLEEVESNCPCNLRSFKL